MLELIYTSAPSGLAPGSNGFCTVQQTRGMSKSSQSELEGFSGLELNTLGTHAKREGVYSHVRMRLSIGLAHVLTRSCVAGRDYSGRGNKLVHHVALQPNELLAVGPAALSISQSFLRKKWDGTVCELDPRASQRVGDVPPGTRYWEQVTGDSGWAGYLLGQGSKPVWIIVPDTADALRLTVEALSLLPAQDRWKHTYSTEYQPLPAGISCQWKFVSASSPYAANARSGRSGITIDASSRHDCPHSDTNEFITNARAGNMVRATGSPRRQSSPANHRRGASTGGGVATISLQTAPAPVAATARPNVSPGHQATAGVRSIPKAPPSPNRDRSFVRSAIVVLSVLGVALFCTAGFVTWKHFDGREKAAVAAAKKAEQDANAYQAHLQAIETSIDNVFNLANKVHSCLDQADAEASDWRTSLKAVIESAAVANERLGTAEFAQRIQRLEASDKSSVELRLVAIRQSAVERCEVGRANLKASRVASAVRDALMEGSGSRKQTKENLAAASSLLAIDQAVLVPDVVASLESSRAILSRAKVFAGTKDKLERLRFDRSSGQQGKFEAKLNMVAELQAIRLHVPETVRIVSQNFDKASGEIKARLSILPPKEFPIHIQLTPDEAAAGLTITLPTEYEQLTGLFRIEITAAFDRRIYAVESGVGIPVVKNQELATRVRGVLGTGDNTVAYTFKRKPRQYTFQQPTWGDNSEVKEQLTAIWSEASSSGTIKQIAKTLRTRSQEVIGKMVHNALAPPGSGLLLNLAERKPGWLTDKSLQKPAPAIRTAYRHGGDWEETGVLKSKLADQLAETCKLPLSFKEEDPLRKKVVERLEKWRKVSQTAINRLVRDSRDLRRQIQNMKERDSLSGVEVSADWEANSSIIEDLQAKRELLKSVLQLLRQEEVSLNRFSRYLRAFESDENRVTELDFDYPELSRRLGREKVKVNLPAVGQ